MILDTGKLITTALTKPTIQTVGNDWRKRYIQVANFSNFNAASKGISNKLTAQEIIGIIKKKEKIIKKWKPKNKTKKIKVFGSQLKTQLYQFFPQEGVMAIPFEITFYNTSSNVEEELAVRYQRFLDWNLILSPGDFKDYFKMKEEILNKLDDSDYEDILLHFYEDLWFGTKKFQSYVWYDIRSVNIKNLALDGSKGNPAIIIEGYIYFWGDLFLEKYLKDSLIEYKKYFGTREFTLRPNKITPLFLRIHSGNTFQDWMRERIRKYFIEGSNAIDDIFKTQLGRKDWKGVMIAVEPEGIKDLKIIFNGIYNRDAIPSERIWNDSSRFIKK